jgi:hypothetical protein
LISKSDYDNFAGKQPLATNLTSLSGLTFVSNSFVKMSATGTFNLDTATYLQDAPSDGTTYGRNNGAWVAAGGSSPLSAKGDLYTYTTVNARLPVGTNGQVLLADSTAATGLRWTTALGSAGVVFDGLGGVISNGKIAYVQVPYKGIITAWYIVANASGSCIVTAKKDIFTSFPPTTALLTATLSGTQTFSTTGLSIAVAAGDWISFTISGVSTVSWVNLTLSITKTV